MIAQAIVALLQQASEIGRATVRSSSFIARPPITSSSGFRRLQCHAAEESGGPKFYPQYFGRPIGGLLFRGTGSARGSRKNISRVDRRHAEGSTCCCLLPHRPHSRHHPARRQCRRPLAAHLHARARA